MTRQYAPPTDPKRCTKCGRLLPLSMFYRANRRGRQEYRPDCKDCKNLANMTWRYRNLAHWNTYMSSYRKVHGQPGQPIRKKRWALRKALRRQAEREGRSL